MKHSKFDIAIEKITTFIIYVCASPFIVWAYMQHIYEEIKLTNDKLRDKLFMRRFRLHDDKMVSDFIEWHKEYDPDSKKVTKWLVMHRFSEEIHSLFDEEYASIASRDHQGSGSYIVVEMSGKYKNSEDPTALGNEGGCNGQSINRA